jgi:hypothetical protein
MSIFSRTMIVYLFLLICVVAGYMALAVVS